MPKEHRLEIQVAVDASVKVQALSFQAQLKHAPTPVPGALFATCALSLGTGVVCYDDSETESEEDKEEEEEVEEEPAPKRARTHQDTQQWRRKEAKAARHSLLVLAARRETLSMP